MGTENIFHKRKAKNAKELRRKSARRETYKKILIVCEGEKTEPNYFNDAREYYSLNSVNVEVRGDCGSDPVSIVEFAKQRYREEKDAGDPFDCVYCVFDRDGHPEYSRALNVIASAVPQNTFCTINSVPCFEYWLLLHFKYSTAPYTALPGNSSGNQVLKELKGFLHDYEKGRSALFRELIDQLPFATANAKRALRESEENGTDNPSTRIHILIDELKKIKA